MSILNQVKCFDNDFEVQKSENAGAKVYYIPDRLVLEINKLDNDKYLTAPEVQKFIKYKYISQFISINRKYFLKGLYHIDLSNFIEHLNIKGLSNKIIIKKEHLQYFIDFADWWEEVKEIRRKQGEYRKALKKYYGNPSEATKECIAINYNCSECSHVDTCKLLKTEISKKQFAKAVSIFYGDKETVGKTDLINQVQYLEKRLERSAKARERFLKKYSKLFDELTNLRRLKSCINLQKDGIKVLEWIAEGKTQREIAVFLGVTPSRVHNIKNKILRQLRTLSSNI